MTIDRCHDKILNVRTQTILTSNRLPPRLLDCQFANLSTCQFRQVVFFQNNYQPPKHLRLTIALKSFRAQQLKIGILVTGYPPEETVEEHEPYDIAFQSLLSGNDFTFESWACLDGVFPDSINDADGWLITGSKFGAYEKLPWIAPLEHFIRDAYSNDVPIVGICFGHQVMAKALGGTVEKYDKGWSVGRVEYTLEGHSEPVPLYAWHQDQVVSLPEEARVVGSTRFCPYAALAYGDKAYSIQPHPEFTEGYFAALFSARKNVLPEIAIEAATNSVKEGKPTNSAAIANTIAAFFKNSHSKRHS